LEGVVAEIVSLGPEQLGQWLLANMLAVETQVGEQAGPDAEQ
jgi:hypothetical protein